MRFSKRFTMQARERSGARGCPEAPADEPRVRGAHSPELPPASGAVRLARPAERAVLALQLLGLLLRDSAERVERFA